MPVSSIGWHFFGQLTEAKAQMLFLLHDLKGSKDANGNWDKFLSDGKNPLLEMKAQQECFHVKHLSSIMGKQGHWKEHTTMVHVQGSF